MIRHILVAIDGSDSAKKAARYAHDLAAQTGATITLLFAVEPPRVLPIGPLDSFAISGKAYSEEDLKAVEKMLDSVAADLPKAKVDKRVVVGAPADTIVDQAAQLNCDLIVVGARGLTAGGRWLLGSVSDRVVHHAGRPVTVVP